MPQIKFGLAPAGSAADLEEEDPAWATRVLRFDQEYKFALAEAMGVQPQLSRRKMPHLMAHIVRAVVDEAKRQGVVNLAESGGPTPGRQLPLKPRPRGIARDGGLKSRPKEAPVAAGTSIDVSTLRALAARRLAWSALATAAACQFGDNFHGHQGLRNFALGPFHYQSLRGHASALLALSTREKGSWELGKG